jgi:hypothetical protein
MKQKTFFLFLVLYQIGFSQEQYMDCATTIIMNQNVQNLKVLKYPENLFIKKIQNFKSAKNDTPENLMISVLSSSNMEWYNFNKEKKTEKTNQDFKYISKINPNDYYAQLKYRIVFEANGTEYSIIKYVLFDNKKAYGFAESMKKINNKWFTTTDSGITNFVFFMGIIDVKYIDAIFNNSKSDNLLLNKIVSENDENGKLNLIKILKELENSLSKKDKEIISILDSQRIFK